MKMKMVLLASLCALSSSAFSAATLVCEGGAAINGTLIPASTDQFVRTAFTPKCSANIFMAYDQNATAFAASAGSRKGNAVFGGHSGGGGVAQVDTCDLGTGCTSAKATGALPNLMTAASSS